MTIVRTFLALLATHSWFLFQMDASYAFLQGDLGEETYMQIPQGFSSQGENNKVCRPLKSLYGLKQASRQRNINLQKLYWRMFSLNPSITTLYFLRSGNRTSQFYRYMKMAF